jgi:hypothetical protein
MLPIEELRVLASYHGTLLWLDNRFSDPSDPNDTVLTQVTASFAQYENKKRSEHMTKARMAKARQGFVVSPLPVGWVPTPDGKYDYDAAVKDAISAIIDTFMKVRSIRQTVKALIKEGIKVPARQGRKLKFTRPTLNNVRNMLINPAYTGTYVYGKTESQRGGPVLATGQSPRVKVPEHRWVRILNHHPAYMTVEQQEEIKIILANNNFVRRNRPGRGPALTQGLLRCTVCGKLLSVTYHRNRSYSYGCGWRANSAPGLSAMSSMAISCVRCFGCLKPHLWRYCGQRWKSPETRSARELTGFSPSASDSTMRNEKRKSEPISRVVTFRVFTAMLFRDWKMCFRKKKSSSGRSRSRRLSRKSSNPKRNWKNSANSPVICLAYGIIQSSQIRNEKKSSTA